MLCTIAVADQVIGPIAPELESAIRVIQAMSEFGLSRDSPDVCFAPLPHQVQHASMHDAARTQLDCPQQQQRHRHHERRDDGEHPKHVDVG
jgi:hypothetical protein